MTDLRRRKLLGWAGAATTLPLFSPLIRAAELIPRQGMRVVIVGGGFAGAIAAKTLRQSDPGLEVVLVDRNRAYSALPGANWVLAGGRRIGENRLTYDRLEGLFGLKTVFGEVRAIDPEVRKVVLNEGHLSYDMLLLAPGIDFRSSEIEGYDPDTTPEIFPHAWRSGEEILALKKRIEEMKDGGVILMSLPEAPFRCPQAAYERASQIALYLRQSKPRSKLIVLDANASPGDMANLFIKGWQQEYKGIIEYRPGQPVGKIDVPRSRVITPAETLTGDVVNLIPPQYAAAIAHKSGLVGDNKRWCPVDHATFESTLAPRVFVLGDACLAEGVQKTASAANAQGKACAINLVIANARRRPPQAHLYSNVCYSFLTEREAASSLTVHRSEGRRPELIAKGGGVSPDWSLQEGIYARAWLGAILAEMSS